MQQIQGEEFTQQTSIFDPVLCELMYGWFSKDGDKVLDPFAGGSVRGIVAAKLGRRYVGIDLSERQVRANIKQGEQICEECPTWVCGDSTQVDELAHDDYDYLFTCPPYADLEVYSNDSRDLSNMSFDDFKKALGTILLKSMAMLRQDRFATIVIGDVRDKNGFLRNLPNVIIEAMGAAGAWYYNEAMLLTSCGTAPIRARSQFERSRKLVKTHQNVLVFCKGDPKRATDRLGEPVFLDTNEWE